MLMNATFVYRSEGDYNSISLSKYDVAPGVPGDTMTTKRTAVVTTDIVISALAPAVMAVESRRIPLRYPMSRWPMAPAQ